MGWDGWAGCGTPKSERTMDWTKIFDVSKYARDREIYVHEK